MRGFNGKCDGKYMTSKLNPKIEFRFFQNFLIIFHEKIRDK